MKCKCGVITKMLIAFMGNDTSDVVCRVSSANEITDAALPLAEDWMIQQDLKMQLTTTTYEKRKKWE